MTDSNLHEKRPESPGIIQTLKGLDHKIESFIQHTIDEVEQVYVSNEAVGHNSLESNKKQKTQTVNH